MLAKACEIQESMCLLAFGRYQPAMLEVLASRETTGIAGARESISKPSPSFGVFTQPRPGTDSPQPLRQRRKFFPPSY